MSTDLTPSVRIWPYSKAPEELLRVYREEHGEEGDEELVLFVPPEMIDPDGKLNAQAPALWFLDRPAKYPGHEQYAGDEWGYFSLHALPDGGRFAVTRDSLRSE